MGLEKQVAKIGRLEELATNAKESLVGAINEVAAGGGGGGGGGALVVAFEVDSDSNVTGSLSPAEVKNAMLTSVVIGTKSADGADPEPIGPAFYDPDSDSVNFGLRWGEIGFVSIITSDQDVWTLGQ